MSDVPGDMREQLAGKLVGARAWRSRVDQHIVYGMIYWIFDQDETPQGFPLQRLARRVREEVGPTSEFFITRGWGYGLEINEWISRVDSVEKLPIPFEELDRLSAGVDEWFYAVSFEAIAGTDQVNFGMFDSSFMYVEGPAPQVDRIVAGFSKFESRPG